MKVVGFEQGSVTVRLSAAECQALADVIDAAESPLSEAFRVCARVAAAQSRRALTVRVLSAPLATVRHSRAIVLVD